MPRLIVSLDGMVVQDYVLKESRTTLGRRSSNDIILTDMAVSGEHVAFTYEKKIGIVVVEDLGSTNGTRVNGIKIRRQVLQSGDLLDIGRTVRADGLHVEDGHARVAVGGFERGVVEGLLGVGLQRSTQLGRLHGFEQQRVQTCGLAALGSAGVVEGSQAQRRTQGMGQHAIHTSVQVEQRQVCGAIGIGFQNLVAPGL